MDDNTKQILEGLLVAVVLISFIGGCTITLKSTIDDCDETQIEVGPVNE